MTIRYVLAQAFILAFWLNDWRVGGTEGPPGGAPISGTVLFTMIFAAIPAIVVGLIDGLFGGVREGWIVRLLLTALLLIFTYWVVIYGGISMYLEDAFGQTGRQAPSLQSRIGGLVAMEVALALEIGIASLVRRLRR